MIYLIYIHWHGSKFFLFYFIYSGSDVHYLEHGAIGDFIVKSPMVLGHESSGIIVQVGDQVLRRDPSKRVGARVAIEPGRTCGACSFCKGGNYEV